MGKEIDWYQPFIAVSAVAAVVAGFAVGNWFYVVLTGGNGDCNILVFLTALYVGASTAFGCFIIVSAMECFLFNPLWKLLRKR